jgi:hypothetical protein
MNKRFCISGGVAGVASLMLGFVIHGMLLQRDYARLPALFRSEADASNQFPFMLLAHLMIGFGMTWMYRRSPPVNENFLGAGLRFGVAVAVLMTVPMYLIYYAVQPMPGAVVMKQIGFDVLSALLLGVLIALLNRPPKAS